MATQIAEPSSSRLYSLPPEPAPVAPTPPPATPQPAAPVPLPVASAPLMPAPPPKPSYTLPPAAPVIPAMPSRPPGLDPTALGARAPFITGMAPHALNSSIHDWSAYHQGQQKLVTLGDRMQRADQKQALHEEKQQDEVAKQAGYNEIVARGQVPDLDASTGRYVPRTDLATGEPLKAPFSTGKQADAAGKGTVEVKRGDDGSMQVIRKGQPKVQPSTDNRIHFGDEVIEPEAGLRHPDAKVREKSSGMLRSTRLRELAQQREDLRYQMGDPKYLGLTPSEIEKIRTSTNAEDMEKVRLFNERAGLREDERKLRKERDRINGLSHDDWTREILGNTVTTAGDTVDKQDELLQGEQTARVQELTAQAEALQQRQAAWQEENTRGVPSHAYEQHAREHAGIQASQEALDAQIADLTDQQKHADEWRAERKREREETNARLETGVKAFRSGVAGITDFFEGSGAAPTAPAVKPGETGDVELKSEWSAAADKILGDLKHPDDASKAVKALDALGGPKITLSELNRPEYRGKNVYLATPPTVEVGGSSTRTAIGSYVAPLGIGTTYETKTGKITGPAVPGEPTQKVPLDLARREFGKRMDALDAKITEAYGGQDMQGPNRGFFQALKGQELQGIHGELAQMRQAAFDGAVPINRVIRAYRAAGVEVRDVPNISEYLTWGPGKPGDPGTAREDREAQSLGAQEDRANRLKEYVQAYRDQPLFNERAVDTAANDVQVRVKGEANRIKPFHERLGIQWDNAWDNWRSTWNTFRVVGNVMQADESGAAEALKRVQELSAQIAKRGEVGGSDRDSWFGQKGLNTVVSMVPDMAETVLTTLGGAAVGTLLGPEGTASGAATGLFAKAAMKKMLLEETEKWVGKGMAKDAARSKAAGLITRALSAEARSGNPGLYGKILKQEVSQRLARYGVFASSFRGNAGEYLQNTLGQMTPEDLQNDPGRVDRAIMASLALGVPAAMLDVLDGVETGAAKRLLGQTAGETRGLYKNALKDWMKHLGGAVMKEGATGFGQGLIGVAVQRLVDQKPLTAPLDDQEKQSVIDNMVGEAFGGGTYHLGGDLGGKLLRLRRIGQFAAAWKAADRVDAAAQRVANFATNQDFKGFEGPQTAEVDAMVDQMGEHREAAMAAGKYEDAQKFAALQMGLLRHKRGMVQEHGELTDAATQEVEAAPADVQPVLRGVQQVLQGVTPDLMSEEELTALGLKRGSSGNISRTEGSPVDVLPDGKWILTDAGRKIVEQHAPTLAGFQEVDERTAREEAQGKEPPVSIPKNTPKGQTGENTDGLETHTFGSKTEAQAFLAAREAEGPLVTKGITSVKGKKGQPAQHTVTFRRAAPAPVATPAPAPASNIDAARAKAKAVMDKLYWEAKSKNEAITDILGDAATSEEVHRAFQNADPKARIMGHGMVKHSVGEIAALEKILTGGIDPKRGNAASGNGLNVAALGAPDIHTGATPGGTAYRDGSFILLSRDGRNIMSTDNIGAILVNPALAEAIPHIQEMVKGLGFDIPVHSFLDAKSAVDSMQKGPAAKTETEAPVPATKPSKSESPGASVPLMVTKDMRQQLYDRGHTKAQVDAMKPEEAHRMLNSPGSKSISSPSNEGAKSDTLPAQKPESTGKLSEKQAQVSDKIPSTAAAVVADARAQMPALNPKQQGQLDSFAKAGARFIPAFAQFFSGVRWVTDPLNSAGMQYDRSTGGLTLSLPDLASHAELTKNRPGWALSVLAEEAIHAVTHRLIKEGKIDALKLMTAIRTEMPETYKVVKDSYKRAGTDDEVLAYEFLRIVIQKRIVFDVDGVKVKRKLTEEFYEKTGDGFSEIMLAHLRIALQAIVKAIRGLFTGQSGPIAAEALRQADAIEKELLAALKPGKKTAPAAVPIEGYRHKDSPESKDYVENGGWKLHLTVKPENYAAVDAWLDKNHPGQYKLLQGGDAGEKDFTIYVGHKDDATALAGRIQKEIGNKIEASSAGGSDTLFNPKVAARFDIQTAKNRPVSDGTDWYSGMRGIPYDRVTVSEHLHFLRSTGAEKEASRERVRQHEQRLDKILTRHFGERYAGKKVSGTTPKPETAGPAADETKKGNKADQRSNSLLPSDAGASGKPAASNAVAKRIDRLPQGDCFNNARKWASENEAPGTLVIHGKATTDEGKVIDHAWVEQGDNVIDPTAGVNMPREDYYSQVKAKAESAYTPEQANVNMIRAKNQGPWTDAERGARKTIAPAPPEQASTPKSSTQFTLAPADAKPLLDFAKTIPDAEVYHKNDENGKEDYGLETEPHVTALYGLTKHEPGPVADALKGTGAVTFTLGKMSAFTDNPDYDVLKVSVTGDQLHAVNKKLRGLPNENTFPDYQPHLTLAYLKKGEAAKYVGDARFEGTNLTFASLTFSPPSHIRKDTGTTEIPLSRKKKAGASEEAPAGLTSATPEHIPPEGAPSALTESAPKPENVKTEKPSLGTTGKEIFQAWRDIQGMKVMPGNTVQAWVPDVGNFAWVNDELAKVDTKKNRDGTHMAFARPATPKEIEEIHDAIDRGTIQIEQRRLTGAMGMHSPTDAGQTTKVLHQATGRPLPEWLETPEGKKWQARMDKVDAEIQALHAAKGASEEVPAVPKEEVPSGEPIPPRTTPKDLAVELRNRVQWKIDMHSAQAASDEGGRGIAAGAEHINDRWKADIMREMLDKAAAGVPMDQAIEQSKATAREWIARHNGRRKGDISWARDTGAADSAIYYVAQTWNQMLEQTKVEAPEESPALPTALAENPVMDETKVAAAEPNPGEAIPPRAVEPVATPAVETPTEPPALTLSDFTRGEPVRFVSGDRKGQTGTVDRIAKGSGKVNVKLADGKFVAVNPGELEKAAPISSQSMTGPDEEDDEIERMLEAIANAPDSTGEDPMSQFLNDVRSQIDPDLLQGIREMDNEEEGEDWKKNHEAIERAKRALEEAFAEQKKQANAAGTIPFEDVPDDILTAAMGMGKYGAPKLVKSSEGFQIKGIKMVVDSRYELRYQGKRVFADQFAFFAKPPLLKIYETRDDHISDQVESGGRGKKGRTVTTKEISRVQVKFPVWIAIVTGNGVIAESAFQKAGFGSAFNGSPHEVTLRPASKAEVTAQGEEWDPAWTMGGEGQGTISSQSMTGPAEPEPFYSQLARAVAEKMPARASVTQALGVISNPTNGVKDDELKWTGIIPWLKSKGEGPVTRGEVLDYLRTDGAVRFEEVTTDVDRAPLYKALVQRLKADDLGGYDRVSDAVEGIQLHLAGQEYNEWSPETVAAARAYFDARQLGNTKYSQYQLPGGTNYRETVLAMPVDIAAAEAAKSAWVKTLIARREAIEQMPHGEARATQLRNTETQINMAMARRTDNASAYTSSHFSDVPNYVAHMRTNERTDAAGKPGLFIEEAQSDRHQKGKKEGYLGENRHYAPTEKSTGIPDAPFRKTWPLQLFKRALRDAVAAGKEWIGWTTGATQGERYDLSKQISALHYQKQLDGYRLFAEKDGRTLIEKDRIPESELEDYVGKDIARKMVNGEGNPDREEGGNFLTGIDLKVGGEGMIGFYDKILPAEVGKYVKQWGGSVRQDRIGNTPEKPGWDVAQTSTLAPTPIWRVDINPAMKAGVAAGQPLFSQSVFNWGDEEAGNRINEDLDRLEEAVRAEEETGVPSKVGDPRLSRSMDNPAVRAIDEQRKGAMVPETFAEWDEQAQAKLDAMGLQPAIDYVIQKVADNQTLDKVDTRLALIVEQRLMGERFQGPDLERYRRFLRAFRQDGTETARSMAARRDANLTPKQRYQKYLLEHAVEPSQGDKDAAAKLRRDAGKAEAPEDAARMRKEADTMEDESSKRMLKKLTDDLRRSGFTLDEWLNTDVRIERRAPIFERLSANLGSWREKAVRRMQGGDVPFRRIARQLGKTEDQVRAVRTEFEKQFTSWALDQLKPGMTADDLLKIAPGLRAAVVSSQSPISSQGMTDEDKQKIIHEAMMKMGLVPVEKQGKARVKASRGDKTPVTPEQAARMTIERWKNRQPKAISAVGNAVKTYHKAKDLRDAARNDLMARLISIGVEKDTAAEMATLAHERLQDEVLGGRTENITYLDLDDARQVVLASKALGTARADSIDKLREGWYNAMLSGPKTEIANFASYPAHLLGHMGITQTLEAGLNSIGSLFGLGNAKTVGLGDLGAMWGAFAKGASEAADLAVGAWKTGVDFLAFDKLMDPVAGRVDGDVVKQIKAMGLELPSEAIKGRLGAVIRIPSRMMQTVDVFGKTIVARMEAAGHALRLARRDIKREGVTYGSAADRQADVQRRVSKYLDTPGSEAWKYGVNEAVEAGFQTPLQGGRPATNSFDKVERMLAGIVGKIDSSLTKRAGSTAGGYIADLAKLVLKMKLLPFTKTPLNVYRIGLRKSPLGALPFVWRSFEAGIQHLMGKKEFASVYGKFYQHLAEQILAWTATAIILGMVEGDPDDDKKKILLVGGPLPGGGDRAENSLRAAATGGNYLLRIGGREDGVEVPFGRIEPVATVLGTAIDMLRAVKMDKGTTGGEKLARFAGTLMGQTQQKTFLRGISDLMNLIDDVWHGNGEHLKQTALDIPASIVPNIIKAPIRDTDEYAREYSTASDAYRFIPVPDFAETKVRPGLPEEVQKAGTKLGRVFLDTGTDTSKPLPVWLQVLNSYNAGRPGRSFEKGGTWAPDVPSKTLRISKGNEVPLGPKAWKWLTFHTAEEAGRRLEGRVNADDVRNPTEDTVKRIKGIYEQSAEAMRERLKRRPVAELKL